MIEEEAWARMEREAAAGEQGVIRRRLATVAGSLGVFAGVELATGRRVVLLETTEPPTTIAIDSAGVSVRVRNDLRPPMLEVTLREAAFAEVFTTFVNDLVTVADRDGSHLELLDRVQTWIRFFAQSTPNGLSGFARRGLWGELLVLRELAVPAWGAADAIEAWTGPDPAIHDFSRAGAAIEVKTSAAHQDQRLTITSERQLDDTNLRLLLLVQVAIDVTPGDEHTLPAMVAEIRSIAAGAGPAAVGRLERQLLRAGYLDEHAERYEDEQYAVRSRSQFHVTSGFPRIIEPMAPGVGRVRYELSTSACTEFAVSHGSALDLLGVGP